MNADIIVNRPDPIVSEQQLDLFYRATNVKQTIKTLEAGNPVLITAFYSNGLLLLLEFLHSVSYRCLLCSYVV